MRDYISRLLGSPLGQVRPALPGALPGLLAPPALDGRVVAGEQHVRDAPATELRRAQLYYLRGLVGKAARIRERGFR